MPSAVFYSQINTADEIPEKEGKTMKKELTYSIVEKDIIIENKDIL